LRSTKGFEEERKRGQIVLFPVRLDETVMKTDEALAAKLRARLMATSGAGKITMSIGSPITGCHTTASLTIPWGAKLKNYDAPDKLLN
jgi:hypothetical protein